MYPRGVYVGSASGSIESGSYLLRASCHGHRPNSACPAYPFRLGPHTLYTATLGAKDDLADLPPESSTAAPGTRGTRISRLGASATV